MVFSVLKAKNVNFKKLFFRKLALKSKAKMEFVFNLLRKIKKKKPKILVKAFQNLSCFSNQKQKAFLELKKCPKSFAFATKLFKNRNHFRENIRFEFELETKEFNSNFENIGLLENLDFDLRSCLASCLNLLNRKVVQSVERFKLANKKSFFNSLKILDRLKQNFNHIQKFFDRKKTINFKQLIENLSKICLNQKVKVNEAIQHETNMKKPQSLSQAQDSKAENESKFESNYVKSFSILMKYFNILFMKYKKKHFHFFRTLLQRKSAFLFLKRSVSSIFLRRTFSLFNSINRSKNKNRYQSKLIGLSFLSSILSFHISKHKFHLWRRLSSRPPPNPPVLKALTTSDFFSADSSSLEFFRELANHESSGVLQSADSLFGKSLRANEDTLARLRRFFEDPPKLK